MRKIQKIATIISEKTLLVSGSLTSIVILLMVFFLFREGIGLFSSPEIERGYVLAVNSENPIKKLSPQQILNIFDGKLTQWSAVGCIPENVSEHVLGGASGDVSSPWAKGAEQLKITPFRMDDILSYCTEEELGAELKNLPNCLSKVVSENPGIIAYFPEQYLSSDFAGKVLKQECLRPSNFLGGREWYPTSQPAPQFGLLPLLMGTLWVTFWAILIALPFGLAAAIYMAELASERARSFLKPVIELLAGIPSVVYGFFGLVVIVPLIQKSLELPVGETGLAGSIVLAIMALPTIITVAEDAMRTTPRAMKEASLALGATHWQTIYKVVIPHSASGITAAIVLGLGRAIGETMAVLMVTGNAAVIPHTIAEPMRTIPATIAAELGEAPVGGPHYQALFLLGCILFLITLLVSISVEAISAKQYKQRM